ncbi:MAG: alpha/beta fold hydrolase, partial [Solirubrobacteraceae bacterium]
MNATQKMVLGRAAQGRARWLALHPHPVLAFLYPAADGAAARSTAVLFCPAFGWEEMCAYRGRRVWAQSLAQAGFPAATFSLPGCGDSGGSPRDPGLLDIWTASVSETAGWLAAATDAERVCAIGIGLGGILACRALAAGAPIDDLILWGVPARGRTWLRELRAYARIIGSRHPEDHQAGIDSDDDHEYTGFLLSADTARGLEELRLTELELPRRPDRRVLLLGRDGSAPDRAL